MPILQSPKKNLRKSQKNEIRNKRFKGQMKEMIKSVKDAMLGEKKADAAKLLPKAFSLIDRASKKNLMHKNTAARRKSSLAKLVG